MNIFWQKAVAASMDAQTLLEGGRYDGAANRAYYAMFNGVRAFLNEHAALDVLDIRRHSAVLRLFSLHAVKSGLVDRELSRAINEGFELRAVADYADEVVTAVEAAEAVGLMSRLLVALEPFIADSRPS